MRCLSVKICNFFHVAESLQDGHWEDAGEGATGLLKKTKSFNFIKGLKLKSPHGHIQHLCIAIGPNELFNDASGIMSFDHCCLKPRVADGWRGSGLLQCFNGL